MEILNYDDIDENVKNVMCYIEEKSESKGWENAECLSIEKFGEVLTREAIHYIMKFGYDR